MSYEAFAKVFGDVMLATKRMQDGRVAAENKVARDRVCSKKFQLHQRRLEAVSTARTLLKQERPRPDSCPVGEHFRRQPASIQTCTHASFRSLPAQSPDMMHAFSPGYSDSAEISPTSEAFSPEGDYGGNGQRGSWGGECRGRSGSAASDVYGQRFAEGAMAPHTPDDIAAQGTRVGGLSMLKSPPEQIRYLRQELLNGQCQVLAKKAVRTRRLLEVGPGKTIVC